MKEPILNKIKRKIFSKFYIDNNLNYHSTVFLAGTARSGTTWVSDLINYKNEYRYMFEPFHSKYVSICKNFRYRQYLRQNNQQEEFIEPAKKILSGNIKNKWIDSQNKKLFSKNRLIKDVRANLLLGWIKKKFPDIKIILLLRHPCAVANSRLKLHWETHINEFLSQEQLMEDFLNPFKNDIEKAQTNFEKHIFLWCIEYYVPLKQFTKEEIHLAFYENFCESPKQEINRLFLFLGKTYDETIYSQLKIQSLETAEHSAILRGANLIDTWKKHISIEQIEKAIEILNLFSLDAIYDQDSMPNIDNALHLYEK